MKTNEDLKELFDGLDFDIAEPAADHETRFREKLRQQSKTKKPERNRESFPFGCR